MSIFVPLVHGQGSNSAGFDSCAQQSNSLILQQQFCSRMMLYGTRVIVVLGYFVFAVKLNGFLWICNSRKTEWISVKLYCTVKLNEFYWFLWHCTAQYNWRDFYEMVLDIKIECIYVKLYYTVTLNGLLWSCATVKLNGFLWNCIHSKTEWISVK